MYKPSKMFNFIDLIVRFSFILILFLLAFTIISATILSTNSEDVFIVKEKYPYKIVNNSGNTPYFSTTIDSKYINGTFRKIEKNPKKAVLIKIYFYSIPTIFTLLFCSYMLKKVINDLFVQSKRFTMAQVKNIKIISLVVVIYFLCCDVIVQSVYSLWLGYSIFYIESIHVSGLLYAGLIYLLAEVFRYGAFLQESYDTTL